MKSKHQTTIKMIEIYKKFRHDAQTSKRWTSKKAFFYDYATACELQLEPQRECGTCKGSGLKSYQSTDPKCWRCDGAGFYYRPKFHAILDAMMTERAGPWRVKTKAPDWRELNYYFWRKYRFHAGLDVTLPMMAETFHAGNTYTDEIDTLALILSTILNGHHSAGAARWGALLSNDKQPTQNMPASAYACGPVCDDNKPDFEESELR